MTISLFPCACYGGEICLHVTFPCSRFLSNHGSRLQLGVSHQVSRKSPQKFAPKSSIVGFTCHIPRSRGCEVTMMTRCDNTLLVMVALHFINMQKSCKIMDAFKQVAENPTTNSCCDVMTTLLTSFHITSFHIANIQIPMF